MAFFCEETDMFYRFIWLNLINENDFNQCNLLIYMSNI